MANRGEANTNSSQFYITLDKTEWLDDSCVVFGRVSTGFELIKRISEEVQATDVIRINKCGELGARGKVIIADLNEPFSVKKIAPETPMIDAKVN